MAKTVCFDRRLFQNVFGDFDGFNVLSTIVYS